MNVVLHVAAETVDSLAEHRHLDLGGTCIGAMGLMGVDQLLLFGSIERHARVVAPETALDDFTNSEERLQADSRLNHCRQLLSQAS